jgi:hypothetical protein
MQWLIKILSLIIFALLGGIFFAVTANILIATGAMQNVTSPEAFGTAMTFKAAIVWMVSLVIGAGSLFIKQKWRYALTLLPLYMPSLFAIFYTLLA